MAWEVIDVSQFNTINSYSSAAASVDGVIIRCGYRGYGSAGTLAKDSKFEMHYSGFSGVAEKIGYYWFSQAISDAEARAEADYVIDTLLAGKRNDMPIYFDSEMANSGAGRADGLSKAARTQYCVAWINRIKERGYRAGVYASESWFVSNLDFSTILNTGASIWVAKYSSYSPSTSSYDAWQFTSSASISGISGNVDKSHFYKDVAGWDDDPTIHVTSVNISNTSLNLTVGQTYTLSASVNPSNATDQGIIWEAENSSIASVNSSGVVTAVGAGTAKIWAEAHENSSIYNTCTVTVSAIRVTGVTLNKSTLNLDISETETLIATVLPSNAGDKSVSWSSSNTAVAIVNSNGLVNPVGNGTCIITVTTNDGGFTASCTVTITTKITGIKLDRTSITIEKGDTDQLYASLIPETATPKPITWSSSNTSIATVDDGLITTLKAGKVTITASVETFSASCECNIIVYPTNITLNFTEITHVVNESPLEDLKVTFEPEDCTERNLVWSSTNSDIVYYDTTEKKLVYTGEMGACYIIAKDVKDHEASCKIEVYIRQATPLPPIMVDCSEYTITLEEKEYMEYSINDGLTWQRDNLFDKLDYNKKYLFCQRLYTHDYYLESFKSGYCEAYTKDIIHVESVKLDTNQLSLKVEEDPQHQFSVTIEPEDAEIKTVLYSFTNSKVGTINSSGLFKALGPGEGTVTVMSMDGGKTDNCTVKVYKKWDKPEAPIITDISSTTITLYYANDMVYSIDGGKTWSTSNIITDLKPNTVYKIVCKLQADGYMLDSDISNETLVMTPATDPESQIPPTSITLSAHKLYFDLNKNTYATLNYTITPANASNKNVIWYSSDDSVMKVNTNGEIYAMGVGSCLIFIRTIAGAKSDSCLCYVYKTIPKPEPPTLKEVTQTTIELNPVDNCEYSIDGINWRDTPLFENLQKDSYYTLYQRVKGEGDYQPPSDPSFGLTIKTLTDEKPGGESPSGYKWAQEVELNNIPIYASPFAQKSDITLEGRYYIFNLIESNHRIRITDIEDFAGVYGHSIGWVKISDLKLIENEIYVGDKVVVDGDINIYSDGSGTFIHKNKEEMYITDIIDSLEYCYGVTPKPGMNRQAFAKADQVVKYKIIDIDE